MHWIGLFLVLFGLLFAVAYLAQHGFYELNDRSLTGDEAGMEEEKAKSCIDIFRRPAEEYDQFKEDLPGCLLTVGTDKKYTFMGQLGRGDFGVKVWKAKRIGAEDSADEVVFTFPYNGVSKQYEYSVENKYEFWSYLLHSCSVGGVETGCRATNSKGETYELVERLNAGFFEVADKVDEQYWRKNDNGNSEVWSATNIKKDSEERVAIKFLDEREETEGEEIEEEEIPVIRFYDLAEYLENSCFFDGAVVGCTVTAMHANKYELEKSLGSGTYGDVWKARDMKTSMEVAIKFIKKLREVWQSEDEARITKLMSEEDGEHSVEFIGSVDNPNYEAGQEESIKKAIILGLYDGGDAKAYFPPSKDADVISQPTRENLVDIMQLTGSIYSAAKHLLDRHFIYRDFKLENIL